LPATCPATMVSPTGGSDQLPPPLPATCPRLARDLPATCPATMVSPTGGSDQLPPPLPWTCPRRAVGILRFHHSCPRLARDLPAGALRLGRGLLPGVPAPPADGRLLQVRVPNSNAHTRSCASCATAPFGRPAMPGA
jgi:hypothetical protein